MRGPFLNVLRQRDPFHPAIISRHGTVSTGELCLRAELLRHNLRNDPFALVACSKEIDEFVVQLLAFDGATRAFLVTSAESDINPAWPVLHKSQYGGEIEPNGETAWILETSGTTGLPKLIEHTFESLTATTKVSQSNDPHRRWGLLYAGARFAGLQVVLQSLLGGATLVVYNLSNLDEALNFFHINGVTSLSGTPTYWRKILMAPSGEGLPLKQITLGGEIADQPLLDSLSKRYNECSIRHIYASTEVGVGFSVSDCRVGFPASFLDDSSATGIELRIGENSHLLVRRMDGSFSRLVKNNELLTSAGFLDTQDIVKRDKDRVFFLGRANGTINVGGNKVNPETIEAILCSHPQVTVARAFAKPNPIVGSIVMAEVELANAGDSDKILSDLCKLCKQSLLPWQRPASIRLVENLSVNQSGKIVRRNG